MDRNKHVKDYLAYYIAFPHPPRFAVLLNGPWGIGKTFLLKEFLKPLETDGKKSVYVSLYGLSSFDEIDDGLFPSPPYSSHAWGSAPPGKRNIPTDIARKRSHSW